ncbi:alpha/beta fold hydrolase [Mycolicibacterium fortuitum]|jgi:proline iminopeptidase|uniref:alpha/beta fold hydrolase n=1 Tax=Mycolicibacterium fortuitum TaxID=1766 RepID=UPI0007EC1FB7|nr:alpha/beta fold hydrolase [Mycolicibacterium fortuitum]MCA4725882.1 alpha/beta fold hydrolase [Mycolicibacterium fortuitum]OBG51776.1 alpha/beta hydrolase [Mycolicibacterium fortuitum]
MTMNAKRRRVHDKLAALPGVRAVRRPVTPGSDEQFDLFYVRAGRKSARPVVIVPGGPGVASIQPYRGLRRRAAAAGFDTIMIEHRGVGMSRHTDAGTDLPPAAITVEQVVDDVAAVLDDAGVHEALLYGTSYGSYIAAGFGVRHPERVAAMVLDSPLLSTADIEAVRSAIRGLLWEGTDPETADLAPKVRRLVADGALATRGGELAGLLYGFGGAGLLDRQLDLLLRGRTVVWSALARLSRLSTRKAPYRNEVDLVGRIAFRELNYAGVPDGLPLDPALEMADMIGSAKFFEPFEAEPFDLPAELPDFHWPTVVLSGGRDLTTPPAVAERIAELVPGAVLVRMPTVAHSVIDTREHAALAVIRAVRDGVAEQLSATADELDALPARPAIRAAVSAIAVATAVEAAVPTVSHPRQ